MFKKFDKRKLLAVICGGVLLAGYLGGFLKILLDDRYGKKAVLRYQDGI